MKKILSAFLAGAMLCSMLAGCAPDKGADVKPSNDPAPSGAVSTAPTQQEKTTLTFMMWGGMPEADLSLQSMLEEARPDLAEKYEIKTVIGGKQDTEMLEKLRLAVIADNEDVPDFFQVNYSSVPELAEAGIIADLSEAMAPYKDAMNEGIWNLSVYKGKNIGLPFQANAKVWLYRQDMFAEAGIDVTAIKDEDDLIEAGKLLQAKYPDSYIWNIGPQNAHYNLGMITSGNGARFVDDEGNYIVSTDPGTRRAFEMFKKLADSGVTAPINDWTPDWEKAFSDGTLASCLTGLWMTHFLTDYAAGQEGKWAVTQFPALGGAEGGSEAGGALYCVTDKSEHKAEVIEVLTGLMLSPEGEKVFFNHLGGIPMLKEVLEDPAIKDLDDPFYGKYMPEAIEATNRIKVFPFTPASTIEFNIANQYLDKYIAGELSLDEALQGAERDMKNQIGNPFEGY